MYCKQYTYLIWGDSLQYVWFFSLFFYKIFKMKTFLLSTNIDILM